MNVTTQAKTDRTLFKKRLNAETAASKTKERPVTDTSRRGMRNQNYF
jgi:hypothetical protein